MPHTISPSKFEILKRQATRAKKDSGITHSQALDQIAIQQGYSNWSLLAKSVEVSIGFERPYTIQIFCSIPSKFIDSVSNRPNFWVEEIPCLYPPKYYADMRWMPPKLGINGRSTEGVAETIETARRSINFMDSTGLRPSRAWRSIFSGLEPVGLDHTCVWRDELKNIIVTTEPYSGNQEKISKLTDWCNRNEWQMIRAPNNIGIWNPCTSDCKVDCTSHTNMFVMAPKKNGGNVKKVLLDITKMEW